MAGPCKINGVDCPDRWVDTKTLESCHSTCERYKQFTEERKEIRRKQHEETLNRQYDYTNNIKRSRWRK